VPYHYCEGDFVEPTLVVIGISIRSAKLAMRERFLLSPAQKSEALATLVRSDGIDEVIVLSNCNRTEFIVWTQNASEAANSVLRFLTRSSNLKLIEWSNFYRLVGDAAVAHVLRVTAGTDSSVFGEPEATNSVLAAWQQAQRTSTTGRFLDALMAKAFSVAGRVHLELGSTANMVTIAQAAVAACRETLGDLQQRRILILGAGQMALAAVREFQAAEAGEITVVNRSWEHAQQIAKQCKVKAAHAESLWEQVLRVDAVVSATSQRVLMTREELELVLHERKDNRIVLVDVSVPRTIDPNVRTLDGVTAFDLDDLCRAVDQREDRRKIMPVAERIIAEEAAGFRNKLLAESILPTISAVREMLELICQQEMDQLKEQFGPFTEDQEVALQALSSHITQRISATLARQLKEMPGRPELTSAIQQLFQLDVRSGSNPDIKVPASDGLRPLRPLSK
jgi:glutamyl-tRNA reductase